MFAFVFIHPVFGRANSWVNLSEYGGDGGLLEGHPVLLDRQNYSLRL